MRATPNLDFTAVSLTKQWLSHFVEMIKKVYQNLTTVINGNLGFGDGTNADNVNGVWSNVTAPAAPNTDFTITHNLGRIPVGYWVMQADRATDIYTGSVAATKLQLTLRSSVASAVLRLFIVGLLLSILSFSVKAQTTNLTIQVTDLGGQSWNNGTWSVVLSTPPGVNPFGPPFFLVGTTTPVPNQTQSGSLSAIGSATMTLTQNVGILPTGSQWKFLVCADATYQCFSQYILVTASTSATITPPAIVVQSGPGALATAYSDSEVQGGKGAEYYNVTTTKKRLCTAAPGGNCTTWVDIGTGAAGAAAGTPVQMQVNAGGGPPNAFGGTNCTTLDAFPSSTQERHDCDTHFKGPNPEFDITRYGARALADPAQSTTASCNGTTTVTLASAIDFVNGDGIVLHQCGSATSLSTPSAPTAVTPKGILNGATTRSYKIVAEDYKLGMTAASTATATATSAATLGDNTLNITNCTLINGIINITTSANHNFEAGTIVRIANSCANSVWYVQTTPTATTLTINTYDVSRPDFIAFSTTGTIEAPAHNWVSWTSQPNVLRYWVYRQDGGAGNFNLVGVAQGMEPFFDDFGFAVPTTTHMPEVPATAPASATNQALATKIVSGAGTTTITVADAATNTISGVSALHDNTVAYNAAMNAAYANNGGVILTPVSAGTSFVTNFPLVMPQPTVGTGHTVHKLAGILRPYQPIVPANFVLLKGETNNGCGLPSFSKRVYGCILGLSYPMVLMTGQSIATEGILFIPTSFGAPQSTTVLVDNNGASQSPVSINFTNSYIAASGQGANPLTLRGIGFGHELDDLVLSSNSGVASSVFFEPPTLRLAASSISSPKGSPGIGTVSDSTLIGFGRAGIGWDADALTQTVAAQLGGPWTIRNIFTESGCGPVISLQNVVSGANQPGAWEIGNFTISDSFCGAQASFDQSSPSVIGGAGELHLLRGNNGGTSGAGWNMGPNIGNFIEGTTINDAFTPGVGYLTSSIGSFNSGGGGLKTSRMLATDGGIRLALPCCGSTANGGVLFVEGAPPTNVSAVVSAGGSVPVGTHTYGVVAVDWNGGQSLIAFVPNQVVTSSGNQTVTITWTAPTPAPQEYFVFRDNLGITNTPTFTTTFVDTFAGVSTFGVPKNSGGGPSGLSAATGIWSNQFLITNGQFNTTLVGGPETVVHTLNTPDATGTLLSTGYSDSVYDNFNRANGGLGSNWTVQSGSLSVSSNTVQSGSASTSIAQWSANTLSNLAQFSQVTVTGLNGTGNFAGTAILTSATVAQGYACFESTNSVNLNKLGAGGGTITSTGITGVAGDILRMEYQSGVNPNLACKRYTNGVLTNTLTANDLSYNTGNPGLAMFGLFVSIDNWSGGGLRPVGQADIEFDWTQPQHFTQPVTIGPTNPVAGALTANALYVNPVISQSANPAQSGVLRLSNTDAIGWRNNANSGDITLTKTGAASGTLLSDILSANNFGSVAANNFLSGNANPAASGLLRLVNTETITWRNNANNADLSLTKNVSDNLVWPNALNAAAYQTATNCSSSAAPAACGSAAAGSVVIAAGSTTVTVNTTAVTANSQIFLQNDDSLGTKLGVTCNTTINLEWVSARTAGTSFVITTGAAPVTNPECISYFIVN